MGNMSSELMGGKTRKYRLIKRHVLGEAYPYRYIAQVQGYWGWWWSIDWSYSEDLACEYIGRHIDKKRPKRGRQPDEVIKEFTV